MINIINVGFQSTLSLYVVKSLDICQKICNIYNLIRLNNYYLMIYDEN